MSHNVFLNRANRQVGCQMACTFCATGTMGLKGDLSAGEILEQVLHASRVSPIRNVVFMGKKHACLTARRIRLAAVDVGQV